MSRGTVLIVDDEYDARQAVTAIVRAQGFAVSVAASGREALTAIEAGLEPDAIMLDLAMPEMSGEEVFHQLPPHLRRRVILVTAHGERAFPGPFDVVVKPFTIEELLIPLRALAPEDARLDA